MLPCSSRLRAVAALLAALTCLPSIACTPKAEPMHELDLTDLATRYASAWSSQDPERLASFYSDEGRLVVNGGEPAVGRAAIAAKAAAFMDAFPDMLVRLDRVTGDAGHAEFHWIWTGTNTGPGGTGRAVAITGYEEWTLTPDGHIAQSLGHYDEAEYERQVNGEDGGN